MHRVLVAAIPEAVGDVATIDGDEAHHALRVKRVREGERVELLDGRGGIATGEAVKVGKREFGVRIVAIRREEPIRPRVEVWSAVPKGPRLDEMIDQLAQVGVAMWRPLETSRGVVEPRDAKLERIARIAAEASKQCGRAWMLEIGARATMAEALRPSPGAAVVMADASGSGWNAASASSLHTRLLIGPEGGWTDEEVRAGRDAGAAVARFGPHVMRIETAAVAASAAILAPSTTHTGIH